MARNIPYFPDHGVGHSKNVIENIEVLINKNVIKSLSSMDVYGLLSSAWLHDVGLLISEKGGKELSPDEIRSTHNELSFDFIMDNYKELGIKAKPVAKFIGDVCLFHKRSKDIEEGLAVSYPLGGEIVHPQLVAGIFRLADAMDTDYRRAPERMSKYVLSLPQENQMHWEACQLIDGITVDRNAIALRGHFKDEKELEIIRWKVRELYDELWGVKDVLRVYKRPIVDVMGEAVNDTNRKIISLQGKKIFREYSKNNRENMGLNSEHFKKEWEKRFIKKL
ncbi:MAG: hypothetical protein KAU14_03895 [Thermoplasmata archaeon]|nr:hypothetical protein [Thermoplasmata archaeon]